MPTIKKELPRRSGEIISNRYQLRRFTHAQDMHKFLGKEDNALFWKEIPEDLPSGKYFSQPRRCNQTGKYKENYIRIKKGEFA